MIEPGWGKLVTVGRGRKLRRKLRYDRFQNGIYTHHRPPPAQAQAQPAHAQAHAQLLPPLLLLDLPLEVDFGGGFVTLVTPLVKSETFPITLFEKLCVPVTSEAANVDPGSVGMETPPPGVELGVDVCALGNPEAVEGA